MTDAMLKRWRLLLGQYASIPLAHAGFDRADWQMEQCLDFLYGREYERRDLARRGPRAGSLDGSQLKALDWLQRARRLFPRDTFERVQAQALDRYGMTELLSDPATLAQLSPDPALARALLGMRGRMSPDLQQAARSLIRRIVQQLTERLRPQLLQALTGRRHAQRRSQHACAQNFDWQGTIRANLRHYDRERRQLLIERPRFVARQRRRLNWDVILLVDQSGSMVDSVMHSAIMASILASLPGVRPRLLLFDTAVVDLSHLAADPVEVLMTVQLGGGTNIGKAMRVAEGLVQQPQRTVIALISDFCEGATPTPLLQTVSRLTEARVKLLGLAALDDQQEPAYDHDLASRLVARGMPIAALTPQRFAEWLAEVIQ
ncbi:MAG: VWA domain-containing protein [Xanthomonadales bacterium]|nr:VWA domain-containing protein [Xanthomonadales bacterium]MCB1633195.1 VWA domain-containing protein [Xanthomonadales bacterium]